MEFKWHLIRCKTEDHAYLPRMVKDVEIYYVLTEKTENNNFVVKNICIIPLEQPKTTKGYVPLSNNINFEKTVYGWCMDAIEQYPDEKILEEKKMKRILHDMMSRQDLEKGATITEDTVWGYGLVGSSGKTSPKYIDPEATQLPHMD